MPDANASASVAIFRIASRGRKAAIPLIALSVLLTPMSTWVQLSLPHVVVVAIQVSLLASAAALFATPTRVRIGTDGVLVTWAWSRRFIPFARIEHVVQAEWANGDQLDVGVELVLGTDGGKRVRLVTGLKDHDGGTTKTLATVLARALGDFRKQPKSPRIEVTEAMLARGSRDVKGWIAALRSIGLGANSSFRTAPIASDQLLRVVEDSSATPATRAAAALALGADPSEDTRTRLEAATGAVAEPKLRVALERVTSRCPDAELEATLAELDEESSLVEVPGDHDDRGRG